MKKLLLIIPLVILLCFTFSCQQQVEEGITEEEAKSFMDAYSDIWNEGNLDLVDDFYSPDYVRHYVDIYEDIKGIDAYKQWITNTRCNSDSRGYFGKNPLEALGAKILI